MMKNFNNLGKMADSLGLARKKGLTAAGIFVKGEAKPRCPFVTGALRGSIDYEVFDDYAEVGTGIVYAARVEYGQPYLRPAVDENIGRIDKIITDIVKDDLESAGR